MGRVYESSTSANFPPKIRFTSLDEVFPKGTWFVGTKIKEVQGKEFKQEKVVDGKVVTEMHSNKVFTFIVHDTSEDLHIDKKEGKEWKPFFLEPNGEAELNGNKQLDDKLGQVPLLQKVIVRYNGKKLNESTGRKFNDYDVRDADQE
jgi:hypothetical protein